MEYFIGVIVLAVIAYAIYNRSSGTDTVTSTVSTPAPAPAPVADANDNGIVSKDCLLYTSPSPRDVEESRMPSSA